MAATEPLVKPLPKQPSCQDMKNCMGKIKKGIGEEKYQAFLDLVGEYQDKKTSIHKLLEEMSTVLEHDLVEELNQLLPEIERKPSRMEPNCKQHQTRGLSYVFVGGLLGLFLGVWARIFCSKGVKGP